jgi:hypothetical protein
MNQSAEICWLNKSGGLSMEASEVLDCIHLTSTKIKQWTKYIQGRRCNAIWTDFRTSDSGGGEIEGGEEGGGEFGGE